MGATARMCRSIQFGVYESPVRPFVEGQGVELGDIPQTDEDRQFALEDLRKGCEDGIYQEVSRKQAQAAMSQGAVISSAFVVWQEKEEERKGRLVVNLSLQSQHWTKDTVRMETLAEFAMQVQPGDHMLSMDVLKGFRHFRLHPDMRNWFIFRYTGRYFQCVALPFGWGRSPLWFTQLMAPFVTRLRSWGYRVLPYIDDFLIIPTPYEQPATLADCASARERIDSLMGSLGLQRHPDKGEWTGSQVVEHLGVMIDTLALKFYVVPHKAARVRKMAKDLLRQVMLGRRWVSKAVVESFCGLCVSLTLAMPWARFYTRALYWDIAAARPRDRRGRCRLSHQSVRDLRFWRQLSGEKSTGRPILPPPVQASVHTDAADMGYGGTLNHQDHRPGVAGLWCDQGVWSWQDRAAPITYRELKTVRLILQGMIGKQVEGLGLNSLLLHNDNQAVVHITNSFVSASRPLMHELRRLKTVMTKLNIHIRSDWVPSAVNRFADALSRRFPRGDLQIRRHLRRSVAAGMQAPRDAFKYRPLGEHPSVLRKITMQELESDWSLDEVRLLCPPVDLIGPTVNKLSRTKAPAILLIPNWPRQGWHAQALRLASSTRRLPVPPKEVWTAQRKLNPAWRLLELEVNM